MKVLITGCQGFIAKNLAQHLKKQGHYVVGLDKKLKTGDPVFVDEFIGQSIPVFLYEVSHETNKDSQEAVLFYLYIFILFRYFDIKKPFPVNFFDKKFKNSFGVIMDDVIAGLYVVLTLIIFMVIKSKFF